MGEPETPLAANEVSTPTAGRPPSAPRLPSLLAILPAVSFTDWYLQPGAGQRLFKWPVEHANHLDLPYFDCGASVLCKGREGRLWHSGEDRAWVWSGPRCQAARQGAA
eukprot:scaffold652352_cov32-Prasinocladus_malaysianus.AAC.1